MVVAISKIHRVSLWTLDFNLLGLGWWSAVTVGVETGVFLLCALAVDEAVAAVIEALIALGCFFGEPPSVTVGPTDWDRPTEKIIARIL